MTPDTWEWVEADVKTLIDKQVKENLNLDYKRCDALEQKDGKIREISKDVSAFANSAGGTIIYGVIEDKHVPTEIDTGYDPRDKITKEWLEQVINSNIRRRIDGIRINVVDLTTTRPGKVLYVVFVPQSNTAHMAEDHRYYRRFEFQSVPMEDYEVRDVMHRLEAPDLSLEVKLEGEPLLSWGQKGSEPLSLILLVRNQSAEPAFYATIRLYLDVEMTLVIPPAPRKSIAMGLAKLPVGGALRNFQVFLVERLSVPPELPIWEGEPRTSKFAVGPPSRASIAASGSDYFLGCEIRSPKMPTRQRFYMLRLVPYTRSVSLIALD